MSPARHRGITWPLALGAILLLAALSLAGLILLDPSRVCHNSFSRLWGPPIVLAFVGLPLVILGTRNRSSLRRQGPWYRDYTPSEILHTIRWRIRRWRHWH